MYSPARMYILLYEKMSIYLCQKMYKQSYLLHLPIKRINEIPKISCFYYCGHFVPYVSYSDLRFSELAGFYNASDGTMLAKDVQLYANIDTVFYDKPLDWHLRLFVAQNNYRICLMLSDNVIRQILQDYCVPKYIQIGVNMAGHYALIEKKRRGTEKVANVPKKCIIHKDAKDRYIEQFIYYNFLNLLNEGIMMDSEETLKALNIWQDEKNDREPVLEQFKAFIEKGWSSQLRSSLVRVHEVISRIDETCVFFDNGATQCYYVEVNKDAWKLELMARHLLGRSQFITAKFFDMYYSQELGGDTVLSSGEQNLLDLFSRIYDAMVISPKKFTNIESKRLILLDEAEIGFHPDWQRRYINLVIQFIRKLVQNKRGEEFQVLISTHSPILLSDIPGCCVNYLYKDDEGKVSNVSDKGRKESFATNVFEQYKESFFMSSLIGEYARQKLETLVQRIDNLNQMKDKEEEKERLMKEINLIGDIRIQEFLIRKMAGDDIRDEIAYHEARIKELKERRRYE